MKNTRSKIMKGCYKKKTRKNYLGGSNLNSVGVGGGPYPSNGPSPGGFNFLNFPGKRGGGCGCEAVKQSGGCSDTCPMTGGGKHRKHCKCSECKGIKCKCSECNAKQTGGGMSYPNGLIGKPWGSSPEQWPGVDGVDGGRNHLGYNTYSPDDVSRQMKYVSASGGGRKRTMKHRKKQTGGFAGQDLIGLGKFGAGSFYNAIRGYPQPVSPLPWKDQLTKY